MATTNRDFRVKNGLTVEGTATVDSAIFTTSGVADSVAELAWNSEFETIEVKNNDSVITQIGQEHLIRVKNSSGSTAIPNGKVVMFAGATGDTVTVTPAVTDGTYPAEYIVGITTQEIPADGFGFVTQFGYVNGVDTSAWTVGTILYPSTTTPGNLTSTEPSAPAIKMRIAAVTKQNASSGRLLVRTIYSPELEGINDVQITSPSNGQVLAYNSTSGLWTNQTASGGTSTPFETVSINDITLTETTIQVPGDITVVNTSSASFGSSSSGSLTLPSGMQQGDLCFVLIGSDGGNISTSSTGWTLLDGTTTGTEQQKLYYKVMGSTPDTSFVATSLETASAALAVAIRGQNSYAPSKATATGSSGMPNGPSISVTAKDMVLVFGALDDDNITAIAPSGYSNLVSRSSSTAGQTIMTATKIITSTGTEDPDAFTTGGTGTDDWVANTVKVTPALVDGIGYISHYSIESSQVKLNSSELANDYVLNFRWNSSTTLNSQMSTGQSISCAFISTEGSTPRTIEGFTIDGNAQTINWAGGSAPVPMANSKTSYVFSIIKTADATFTVIGSGVTYA